MKPSLRKTEILKLLRTLQREIKVGELAHMLNVSALSIRRDLDQLNEEKAIIRTYGGCMIAGRAALETEYHLKVGRHFNLKQEIGRVAAEQIEPGSTLLINDGSTTFHLATHLGQKAPLTVYTNSLAMIVELGRVREQGMEASIRDSPLLDSGCLSFFHDWHEVDRIISKGVSRPVVGNCVFHGPRCQLDGVVEGYFNVAVDLEQLAESLGITTF